jgi:hypothetical protein
MPRHENGESYQIVVSDAVYDDASYFITKTTDLALSLQATSRTDTLPIPNSTSYRELIHGLHAVLGIMSSFRDLYTAKEVPALCYMKNIDVSNASFLVA